VRAGGHVELFYDSAKIQWSLTLECPRAASRKSNVTAQNFQLGNEKTGPIFRKAGRYGPRAKQEKLRERLEREGTR